MHDIVASTQIAVAAFVRRYGLFSPAGTVVVAVSGGADSVCLLDCLYALRETLDITLHVAHLDHGLRDAAAADDDEAYVRDLAAGYGVPVTCETRDVPALARDNRLSVEAAARMARYDFLHSVAARLRSDHAPERDVVIATGHTASDQAETVLLHLIRGSGLAGLAGMRPRRGDIARPLLEVERATTVDYCKARGLAPRYDPTNDSLVFLRNRVRHELLPALARYNPQVHDALVRTASSLTEDLEYLDEEASRLVPGLRVQHGAGLGDSRTSLEIDRHAWLATPPGLRSHLVRHLLARLYGSTEGFARQHIVHLRQILDGTPSAPSGADETAPVSATTPGTRHVAQFPRHLWVDRNGAITRLSIGPPAPPPTFAAQRLTIPGSVALPGGLLTATYLDTDGPACLAVLLAGGHRRSTTAYLDADVAGDQLMVRPRRSGDSIQPLGMAGHHRKVQDILVDARVPRPLRDAVPLVVRPAPTSSSDEILWVAGLCLADPFRVTALTKRVLSLHWETSSHLWRG